MNTSAENKIPDFFIVGAAKSGTTSLWYYLKENDSVYVPGDELVKEPKFFSDLAKREKMTFKRYLKLFSGAYPGQVIGEASTAYLTDPSASKNIYEFNPEAKIIIILRNPADRAYSLYNWMVQEGYEYLNTFEKALEAGNRRKSKRIPNFWEPEYYWNYRYFASGLYSRQVERYLKLFPTLILKFEDLVANSRQVYNEVCAFLEAEPTSLSPKILNDSKLVHSSYITFALRKLNNIKEVVDGHLLGEKESKKERDSLVRLTQISAKPPKLDPDLRKRLLKKYEPDINRLCKLTGKDFYTWLDE
ncbi:MAG: sulfotransferase domain-containing protein [Bacteroidia bacterium]